MSPRSTRIVRRSTAVRPLKRFVKFSVCRAMSDTCGFTISKAYVNQQRPMVHATDCGITQDRDSSYFLESRWTKNVIDATIVDCCITGSASQIAKVAQDGAVR